jgi:hypothetical protein
MDAGKKHQRFCLVSGKPGIGHIATFLFARGIRFSEAGDRNEAPVFDTKPPFPMRKIEVPGIGCAAVGLHADQLLKIEGLAFSPARSLSD